MKRYQKLVYFLLILILLQYPISSSFSQGRPSVDMPFGVYKDAMTTRDNHYVPSGWMGDYGDVKMNLNSQVTPYKGKSCIKFTYNAKGTQNEGWAGVYFQHPTNNWGMIDGGYNLSKASILVFYARGETGGEIISEFIIGGIMGKYADTAEISLENVTLTKEWQRYTIDLTGYDLERIMGGFCWKAEKEDNPDGVTFYLDEIYYE